MLGQNHQAIGQLSYTVCYSGHNYINKALPASVQYLDRSKTFGGQDHYYLCVLRSIPGIPGIIVTLDIFIFGQNILFILYMSNKNELLKHIIS